MNLDNLSPYVRTLCPPRRFAGLPPGEHGFEAFPSPLTLSWVLLCRCGWRHVLTETAIHFAYASDRFAEVVGERIDEHLAEECRKLSPTLADLTDWGWFHVEAGQ